MDITEPTLSSSQAYSITNLTTPPVTDCVNVLQEDNPTKNKVAECTNLQFKNTYLDMNKQGSSLKHVESVSVIHVAKIGDNDEQRKDTKQDYEEMKCRQYINVEFKESNKESSWL